MGSDRSCMLISSLARLGVSGRMRVFVRSHISLLVARLSSSRLQLPTPAIVCWFYLTEGLKAFRTVITMIVGVPALKPDGTPALLQFVARPLAWEVPAGMGQAARPRSQPPRETSTRGKLSPEQTRMAPMPQPWAGEPQGVDAGTRCPLKFKALPSHRRPCRGRLPVHASNSAIHKQTEFRAGKAAGDALKWQARSFTVKEKAAQKPPTHGCRVTLALAYYAKIKRVSGDT